MTETDHEPAYTEVSQFYQTMTRIFCFFEKKIHFRRLNAVPIPIDEKIGYIEIIGSKNLNLNLSKNGTPTFISY